MKWLTRLVAGFGIAFLIAVVSFAQEQTAPAVLPGPELSETRLQTLRLQDFEGLTIQAVRQEFPRLPGFFASSHSCRLPEYGPVVSITIQPPAFFFTRPVLQELERRQKIAEQQAKRVQTQIERAAQFISLKAKEASLQEKVEIERSKRKGKSAGDLEKDLADLRRQIASMESVPLPEGRLEIVTESSINDMDLNRMISANYDQLLERITQAMKDTLAENGVWIADLGQNEKIGITAYVRDSFMGNQEKVIILVLDGDDIQAFRSGELDLPSLKKRVLVKHEKKD